MQMQLQVLSMCSAERVATPRVGPDCGPDGTTRSRAPGPQMAGAERVVPRLAPTIPALPVNGLPWVRLVTGLVAVAILAMPAGRHAGESTVRPIPDRVIAVAPLPPLVPAVGQRAGPADVSLEAAVPAARSARPTARPRSVLVAAQPKQPRANAASHRWTRSAATRRAAALTRTARASPGLTRAQVVRAYLASREQVAALTREDSGSAYLTQVAARRRDRALAR